MDRLCHGIGDRSLCCDCLLWGFGVMPTFRDYDDDGEYSFSDPIKHVPLPPPKSDMKTLFEMLKAAHRLAKWTSKGVLGDRLWWLAYPLVIVVYGFYIPAKEIIGRIFGGK